MQRTTHGVTFHVHICMAAVDKEAKVSWQGSPLWFWEWPAEKKRKRKDYAFRRQFNEKPSIILGCPGGMAGMSHSTPGHQSNVTFLLQAATQKLPMIRKLSHGWITTHMTKHEPLLK